NDGTATTTQRGEQCIYAFSAGTLTRREIGIDAAPVVLASNLAALTFTYLDRNGPVLTTPVPAVQEEHLRPSVITAAVQPPARPRHPAEPGIKTGFTPLASTSDPLPSSTPALAGATGTAPWVTLINTGTRANVTTGGAAAETTFAGTYTVSVRNDSQAGDPTLTGQSNAGETLTADTNKIVIMRSIGVFNGATKTLEVVVKRQPLPPFPGAVNMPGLQSDTFINKTSFTIDGRDHSCASNCDTQSNWVLSGGAAKYGIATNTGTQTNH